MVTPLGLIWILLGSVVSLRLVYHESLSWHINTCIYMRAVGIRLNIQSELLL